jgi:hypothetical protein
MMPVLIAVEKSNGIPSYPETQEDLQKYYPFIRGNVVETSAEGNIKIGRAARPLSSTNPEVQGRAQNSAVSRSQKTGPRFNRLRP